MDTEEKVVITKKVRKPRVEKTSPVTVVAPLPPVVLRSIRLRLIKWSYLQVPKPQQEDIVAVRYELKNGTHFTTRLSSYLASGEVEGDKVTYIAPSELDSRYFQLSFYASDQRQSDFDTMALIGERGEIVYMYEF